MNGSTAPVTAIIIARNEEVNIERTLESVSFCRERLVVDTGSTDRTVEISRNLGVRVVTVGELVDENFERRARDEFLTVETALRNASLVAANEPWTLVLDADETITADLADLIRKATEATAPPHLYDLKRRTIFRNRPLNCWSSHRTPRLFPTGEASYPSQAGPHQPLMSSLSTAHLNGWVDHYSYRDMQDYRRKFKRYTDNEASYGPLANSPIIVRLRSTVMRSAKAAYRMIVVERGLLDGPIGWRFVAYSAAYPIVVFTKSLRRR